MTTMPSTINQEQSVSTFGVCIFFTNTPSVEVLLFRGGSAFIPRRKPTQDSSRQYIANRILPDNSNLMG